MGLADDSRRRLRGGRLKGKGQRVAVSVSCGGEWMRFSERRPERRVERRRRRETAQKKGSTLSPTRPNGMQRLPCRCWQCRNWGVPCKESTRFAEAFCGKAELAASARLVECRRAGRSAGCSSGFSVKDVSEMGFYLSQHLGWRSRVTTSYPFGRQIRGEPREVIHPKS